METLIAEYEKLEKTGNLEKTIEDVQATIDLLQSARDALASAEKPSRNVLEKLQKPYKLSTDKVNKDLTEVYKALNSYGKALDKKFKGKPLPTAQDDALASHPGLVNRAIAMHLLREGQFNVASTFMEEANAHPPQPEPTPSTPNPYVADEWSEHQDALVQDMAANTFNSKQLQEQFAEMYHILEQLREGKNLGPAIAWARKHSQVLETRGSNLEFELCRLQYVLLFTGMDRSSVGDEGTGPQRAWAYARSTFGPFQRRYQRECQQICGALAFSANVGTSPYGYLFYNESAWSEIAASFTREFCSLLGMSADSPLYIAATAGAIALPTLLKLQNIMKEKRTEWTTQDELPVEIPLPPNYHFHSIFVCPVSKEQTTDENPPMMLPCGHVIAKESLERSSKGSRFKCPYCPLESHPKDAMKIFL